MSNRKLVRDILISIPIGILYIYFILDKPKLKLNDIKIKQIDFKNGKITKIL